MNQLIILNHEKGKTPELSNLPVCVCVHACACVHAQSCLTLATSWTIACKAPLSIGFSRQEHWSGLPFPSPGDLPNTGIETGSPALQEDALLFELQGSPKKKNHKT